MRRYYADFIGWALAGALLVGYLGGFGAAYNAMADWATSVRIHVSFNSLTSNHSKFSRDGRYFMAGTSTGDDRIYVCEVAQEFWEFAEENEHYTLPGKACREVKP